MNSITCFLRENKKFAYFSFLFFFVLIVFPEVISAQQTNKNESSFTTIQAAVDQAVPGSTVAIPAGTYYENLVINKSIALESSVIGAVTIDGQANGPVLRIVGGGNVAVTITAVTLTNGSGLPGGDGSYSGGGIYNTGQLTLINSTITNNTLTGEDGAPNVNGSNAYGGGIYNASGAMLTLMQSTVSQNRVVGGEGGANPDGNGFGGNGGHVYGGGIYNNGTLIVNASFITGNTTQGGDTLDYIASYGGDAYGGGIHNTADGVVTIHTGSYVNDNQAVGGGPNVIDGGPAFGGGISSLGSLDISDTTISANSATGRSTGDNGGRGAGGGLYVTSTLPVTIDNTIIRSNAVTGGSGGFCTGGYGLGGGIFNGTQTIMHVANTSLYENNATGGSGSFFCSGGIAGGGGIFNTGEANLILENVTVSQNNIVGGNYTGSQAEGNAGDGLGGGIYHDASQSLQVNNVVIANNNATGGTITGSTGSNGTAEGGGIWSGGAVNLRNSILAYHSPENCAGTVTSFGYNLSSDASCAFASIGDLTSINPQLGVLQENGGPTPTHALLPNSPAIDAGNPVTPGSNDNACLTLDQRGMVRPFDGNNDSVARCDIGAYEYGSYPPPLKVFLPAILNNFINYFEGPGELEPNGDFAQAMGPIRSGKTYYGNVSSTDGYDYFYFDLAASQLVNLTLTNMSLGENYNLVLRDAALNVVGNSGNVGNADEKIEKTLGSGRYYIQIVYSTGSGSSPYHLSVDYGGQ